MRTGYMMRQQAIAAVYAKVLRLNSASIGDVSAGKARPWRPCMLLTQRARNDLLQVTVPGGC